MIKDYQGWVLGFSIFQFLFNIGVALYLRYENRDKVTSSRIRAAEERISKVETKVQNPSICASHGRMEENDVKLFRRFDELHGDIREMTGSVRSLARSVDLINEHLINGRKG